MSTYENFFLTILALDSYNRGDDPLIMLPGASRAVGHAVLRDRFGDQLTIEEMNEYLGGDFNFSVSDARTAGFFATAYDLAGGETVISYRGTDFPAAFDNLLAPEATAFYTDVLEGWLLGGGILGTSFSLPFGAASINAPNQSAWAELFYLDVTGQRVWDGVAENVTLTGHSLGGGLAGYVASLSGTNAVVVDEMPYVAAAFLRASQEIVARLEGTVIDVLQASPEQLEVAIRQLIEGDPEVLPELWLTGARSDLDNIHAISVAGEFVETVRALEPLLAGFVRFLQNVFDPELATAFSALLLVLRGFVDDPDNRTEYSSFSGSDGPSAVDLHSSGLAAILTYADYKNHTDWQFLGAENSPDLFAGGIDFTGALFDGDVAAILPTLQYQEVEGKTARPAIFQSVIALSLIHI